MLVMTYQHFSVDVLKNFESLYLPHNKPKAAQFKTFVLTMLTCLVNFE